MDETTIKIVFLVVWGFLLLFNTVPSVEGFAPLQHSGIQRADFSRSFCHQHAPLFAKPEDDEEEKPENPYADPNYPDLEFVNYDDPEYQVDQGQGDEFFDPESTEAQIEEMREDRRRRNDECEL